MIELKGGTFLMGNNLSSNTSEKPARKLTVSPFWMGAYEITHDQFNVFYKDNKAVPEKYIYLYFRFFLCANPGHCQMSN